MTSLSPLHSLLEAAEKATPGPWENSRGFVRTVAGNPAAQPPVLKAGNMEVRTSCLWVAECRDGEAFYNPDGNADFIALARNSIEALQSLLADLEGLEQKWREQANRNRVRSAKRHKFATSDADRDAAYEWSTLAAQIDECADDLQRVLRGDRSAANE